MTAQFLRFCLVGAIGFLVDAGAIELLVRQGWAGLYLGRVLSYLLAATITWRLNSRFTFRRDSSWWLYVLLNAAGACVNYGVYVGVLWLVPLTRSVPSMAVAVGAASGLLVNFTANRWLVFRARH